MEAEIDEKPSELEEKEPSYENTSHEKSVNSIKLNL